MNATYTLALLDARIQERQAIDRAQAFVGAWNPTVKAAIRKAKREGAPRECIEFMRAMLLTK